MVKASSRINQYSAMERRGDKISYLLQGHTAVRLWL
uniref:Uncharacterized protein n=1 Tax=Anguilla anguilla TaxID=7936 RepID=A0A0E9SBS4_ANGAN